MVWDLIADRREFIERERKNDSDTYFYDIYGALDTRTDGISAAHYRSGLSLVAADGKILPETYMPVDFDPAFSWATWSADDQYLGLRYAESQRVGIWNPRAKGFVWLDPKGWVAEAYAWSRKGHVLAFTGRTEHQTDVTVQVVDASAPTESKRTVYSGEIPIRTVLFLPGDQRLLVSDRDKNVFVVEISTGKVVAKGSQKNVTKTFGTGDSLYVSSPDVVRVWSNKPAPASGWRFQSSAGRVYRAQGAADALWHWMAVPFVQDKATAGVELRSVISDKKIDLPAPDHDSMSLGFSSDGKWLVLETLKHVRFYEVSTLRFYDFDLMQDDRQFISLRFSNGVVYAHSLGKDWMSNTSNEYDYEIRLDAEPKFVNRTPRKEVRERDQKLDALQKQIDGWDSGTLYGYSSAGLLSATNSDWAYYVKCRDQALGARDCDVQFLPTNLERTMELYDSLVSRPTQERLNSYLQ